MKVRLPLLVATLVPCVVVFVVNASFVWNHFADGPYLHDAGWYSAIVWHEGFLPKNPPAAHPLPDYWGIHVSLLVSVASVLSYLQPLERVGWYAVFQGLIYAPLGAFAGLLSREGEVRWRNAWTTGALGLVFALNGQVLSCTLYPHYEIFAALGIVIMLAGAATGRTSLAWVGLGCAIATREDGGFHAATFLAALLLSARFGRPFPIARRTLFIMTAISLSASVVAMVIQRFGFASASLFQHEYLGHPPFAHLTSATLLRRLAALPDRAAFVVWPFVGAAVVAFARRDARYLLGYVVAGPWFLLNFCAAQDLKAEFSVYTGFPFIGSMAWVGAYGLLVERERVHWMRGLALVSVLAIAGRAFFDPSGMLTIVRRSLPAVERAAPFVAVGRALEANPKVFGSIDVDPAIAAWALRGVTEAERKHHASNLFSFVGRDGLLFTSDGAWTDDLFFVLARSPFSSCGRAGSSRVYLCRRPNQPMPAPFIPASPLDDRLRANPPTQSLGNGRFFVPATATPSIRVFGPYVELPRGAYRAAWKIRWRDCGDEANDAARMRVDIAVDGKTLASEEVTAAESPELRFVIERERATIETRAWSGRCAFELDGVVLSAPVDDRLDRGWSFILANDPRSAVAVFDDVIDNGEVLDTEGRRRDRDSAIAGVATAHAMLGECETAVTALRRLARRDQGSIAERPAVARCIPKHFWD